MYLNRLKQHQMSSSANGDTRYRDSAVIIAIQPPWANTCIFSVMAEGAGGNGTKVLVKNVTVREEKTRAHAEAVFASNIRK
jgi:hypothetical protein